MKEIAKQLVGEKILRIETEVAGSSTTSVYIEEEIGYSWGILNRTK